MLKKTELYERRKNRSRFHVRQNGQGRPRLSVFRSNKHIYAQIIDDASGHTLVSASSTEAALRAAERISQANPPLRDTNCRRQHEHGSHRSGGRWLHGRHPRARLEIDRIEGHGAAAPDGAGAAEPPLAQTLPEQALSARHAGPQLPSSLKHFRSSPAHPSARSCRLIQAPQRSAYAPIKSISTVTRLGTQSRTIADSAVI